MCQFRCKKILKGSLQPKLKGASVWPFNARSRSAYKLKLSYMIIPVHTGTVKKK